MKNWVSRIITVQKLDMRLAALETKYRTIPVERERLRTEYIAAVSKVSAANAAIHKLEGSIKEREAVIADLEGKIKKIQIQSATAKKNSEYQALMNEIASTHAKISELETLQLTDMDALDQAKRNLTLAEQEKAVAERMAKTEMAELNEAAEQIKAEALEVKKKRKEFAEICDVPVLETYTRLREKDRSRQWVVALNNGSCSNCALKITPQTLNEAKKGIMTVCDNCGCILYDADAPSDYQE